MTFPNRSFGARPLVLFAYYNIRQGDYEMLLKIHRFDHADVSQRSSRSLLPASLSRINFRRARNTSRVYTACSSPNSSSCICRRKENLVCILFTSTAFADAALAFPRPSGQLFRYHLRKKNATGEPFRQEEGSNSIAGGKLGISSRCSQRLSW